MHPHECARLLVTRGLRQPDTEGSMQAERSSTAQTKVAVQRGLSSGVPIGDQGSSRVQRGPEGLRGPEGSTGEVKTHRASE